MYKVGFELLKKLALTRAGLEFHQDGERPPQRAARLFLEGHKAVAKLIWLDRASFPPAQDTLDHPLLSRTYRE